MKLGYVSEKGLIELENKNLLCGDKVEKLRLCDHCAFGKVCKSKFNS